jgi:hypothetical protein
MVMLTPSSRPPSRNHINHIGPDSDLQVSFTTTSASIPSGPLNIRATVRNSISCCTRLYKSWHRMRIIHSSPYHLPLGFATIQTMVLRQDHPSMHIPFSHLVPLDECARLTETNPCFAGYSLLDLTVVQESASLLLYSHTLSFDLKESLLI